MEVRSHAKINWALRILGRRRDGFHDLETVFQTISLYDTLWFRPAASMSLNCDDPSVPADERNLVLRAARAIGAPPVAIELKKQIPAGGGLGGGSSNAAVTLVTLNQMFDLGFQSDDLHAMALDLGSDVPFFLSGGTAYATGRGDELASIPSAAGMPLLLLLPDEKVLTADAFRTVRKFSQPVGIERFAELIESGLLAHSEAFVNDFEEPVFAKIPHLAVLRQRLADAGAGWARMSGSGSTIVGAFADEESRDAAAAKFEDIRHAVAVTQ